MKQVKRLFLEFQPEHYELFLEPDRDKSIFSGRVRIVGRKTGRPSQRLTFHQNGLKILSAKITRHDKKGDQEFTVERINLIKNLDEVRLHSKLTLYPGKYTVDIEFSGRISEDMHGIYPCNFELGGQKKQLIATQFESHHAREAFPCIDEPEAKATYDLTLSTPADETAIANTPVKSQKKAGQQKITVFETTPVMSTYLLAFVYGEMDYKEAKTNNSIQVRVFGTPDKVELTDFALDVGVRCLEFFEHYYGVKYPLAKLDLVGLPDFAVGAMENWGLITFRESVLYVDPSSSSVDTKQVVSLVVCHEIAHQWFGNLVTMKWWNDLWLNESFANLMEYVATDALFPEWNIWQDFVQREFSSALGRDSLPNVQPVQTEVNHPDEINTIFDPSIVYAKGGSLLNMLMHLVGEESFRKGLKSYFEDFAFANTTADDLWTHLGKTSQLDIPKLMQNWLQKPGYPAIQVNYEPGQEYFEATQERLVIGDAQKTTTIWQVPLAPSNKTDSSLLSTKNSRFKIKEKSAEPLVLNHNGHSYFAAQYINSDHFSQILKAVSASKLSTIDRLLLVQSYLLLEKAGRITTRENIKLLEAYTNEREVSVWGLLAGIIGNVNVLIGKDETLEGQLNEFVRPLAQPLVNELGWQAKADETAKIHKFRALALDLAAASGTPDVIKEGLSKFQDFKKPADLHPDIRPTVYFIAVRYGKPADFSQLCKLYNSLNNADEKEEIAAELTTTRDASKIELLLKMIIDGDVRPQDVAHWYAWLLRNRYATDLTWEWLKHNWGWITDKFGSDKTYDAFARYAGSIFSRPEQLAEYKEFFKDKNEIALERAIKLGTEEIEGRIAWRHKNEPAVKDWLHSLAS